jgi:ribosomal protein S14
MARLRRVRRCKICGSFTGVKRTRVVALGLRLGSHFSLELVDSTGPRPRAGKTICSCGIRRVALTGSLYGGRKYH